MNDIQWEDPPERYRGASPGHLANFVKELQRHPGKWALYVQENGQDWHGAGILTSLKHQYHCETRCSTIDRPPAMNKNARRIWARWPEDVEP